MPSFNVLNGDKLIWYGVKVMKTAAPSKTHQISKPKDLTKILFKQNPEFIRQLNSAQSLWTASHYTDFESKSLDEIMKISGGRKSVLHSRQKPAKVTPELQKLAATLPAEFDWRNRNGVNYMSPVKAQGSCGSCYSFASTGMLEARLRIMTNNTVQDILSEQDIVDCSIYSQGCDGGFPYLIAGKYAETTGILLDKCKPYTGTNGTCSVPKCNIRYHATNYNYIGGFYGACNEQLMQIALVKNGPIAVSFEVYPDFRNYKSGIYIHTGLQDKLNGEFNPFELTNHVVVVVGYGVEQKTNTKYWIVRNSWGASWGENGYFKIRRGTDECAIESIAVESFPIPI